MEPSPSNPLTVLELLELLEPLEQVCNQNFTEERAKIFLMVLSDLTRDEISAGVVAYVTTAENSFPVMPATIRRLAIESRGQTIDPDTAWGDLLKLVKVYGYYQQQHAMAAMDEATAYAVRACGGFLELCDVTEDNKGQYRKSFRDAYAAFVARQKQSLLTGQPVKLLTDPPRPERPQQVFPDTRSAAPVKRLAESLQLPEAREAKPVKSVEDYAAEAEESRRLQKSKAEEMLRLTGGDQ
jgi:hypothetical protein